MSTASTESHPSLACPSCGTAWTVADVQGRCHYCRAETHGAVFPAAWRETPHGTAGEDVRADDEAACFVHADKRAVEPCPRCGRFMCAMCASELQGHSLCPECLTATIGPDGPPEHRFFFFRADRLGWTLMVMPFLVFTWFAVWAWAGGEFVALGLIFATIVGIHTAPLGLYVAFHYRNAVLPPMAKPSSKALLAVATLETIAAVLVFLAGAGFVVYSILTRFGGGGPV